MKQSIRLFVIFLLTASVVTGQTKRKSSPAEKETATTTLSVRLFPVGGQFVALPEPEGFVEATSQSKEVKEHFAATFGPEHEVLAVHLPPETLEAIGRRMRVEFDHYTTVTVSTAFKEVDASVELFNQVVGQIEQSTEQMLAPNHPLTKELIGELEKNLSDRSKKQTKVNITQPIRFGQVMKTVDVYSQLLLMNISVASAGARQGGPMLCGASIIKVNNKILLVNTYKNYKSRNDIEFMREFTRKWAEQIVKANRQ
ncbi:MAG: hypothetical protein ACRD9R_21100 [Pyrinomonadaceae bacterium]